MTSPKAAIMTAVLWMLKTCIAIKNNENYIRLSDEAHGGHTSHEFKGSLHLSSAYQYCNGIFYSHASFPLIIVPKDHAPIPKVPSSSAPSFPSRTSTTYHSTSTTTTSSTKTSKTTSRTTKSSSTRVPTSIPTPPTSQPDPQPSQPDPQPSQPNRQPSQPDPQPSQPDPQPSQPNRQPSQPNPDPSPSPPSSDYQSDCVTNHNKERSGQGVPPLAWDDYLAGRAATAANNCCNIQPQQQHSDLQGVGQNLFIGHTTCSGAMYETNPYGWVTGEKDTNGGHWENVIGGYSKFGCATYQDSQCSCIACDYSY